MVFVWQVELGGRKSFQCGTEDLEVVFLSYNVYSAAFNNKKSLSLGTNASARCSSLYGASSEFVNFDPVFSFLENSTKEIGRDSGEKKKTTNSFQACLSSTAEGWSAH